MLKYAIQHVERLLNGIELGSIPFNKLPHPRSTFVAQQMLNRVSLAYVVVLVPVDLIPCGTAAIFGEKSATLCLRLKS